MNNFARVCKSSQNNNLLINVVKSDNITKSQSSLEEEFIYTVKTSSAVKPNAHLTTKLKINQTNFQALVDTGVSKYYQQTDPCRAM